MSWDAAPPDRVGAITASDLLNAFQGPKGRRSYVLSGDTTAKQETDTVPETFAMIRGRELEAELDALEEATGISIDVPFILIHIPNFGASPDGIWADKSGLVESSVLTLTANTQRRLLTMKWANLSNADVGASERHVR